MRLPVINMTPERWKVFLIILSIIVAVIATNRATSFYKDITFSSQVEDAERRLKEEAEKSWVATRKAEVFESLARELEERSRAKDEVIKIFGEKGRKAQEAINEEIKKMDDEFADIGIDVPDHVRTQRIRERLRRLYPPAK
jgi:hypothetical protein